MVRVERFYECQRGLKDFIRKGKGRGCRRRRWSSSSLICPVSYSLVGDDDKVCEEGIVLLLRNSWNKRSIKYLVKMT